MSLFTLRGKLSNTQTYSLGIIGLLVFIGAWWLLAESFSEKRPIVDYIRELPKDPSINLDSLLKAEEARIQSATSFQKVYPILPPPDKVLASYASLIQKDDLLKNTLWSMWLNLKGYFWAILIAIPIGFAIGLFPLFRGLFARQVDALRYLPLTALTGLFIIWFGIDDKMKIAFLAFGILVYLLPVVVQRIDEVDSVYTTMSYTLGASNWQMIRSVYFPAVMSKLFDDIRVLTAISWTYIIIAELMNRQGGIGSLIYIKARQGQIEKVFAILIVIVLIGFLQDRLFAYLDKRLFPHKYYKSQINGISEIRYGIYAVLGMVTFKIIQEIFMPSFGETAIQIVGLVIVASLVTLIWGEIKIRKSLSSN